jgi:hypothetical protein
VASAKIGSINLLALMLKLLGNKLV